MHKLPIDNNTKFGTIVKIVRCCASMTQNELGKILGVSTTSISYIERGKMFPSSKLYKKMWKFITDNGISVDERVFKIAYDVCRGKVDLSGMSPEKKLLTAKLASSKLTSSQISLLNKFINGNLNHGK